MAALGNAGMSACLLLLSIAGSGGAGKMISVATGFLVVVALMLADNY